MINGQSRVFAGILSPVVDGGQYSIRRVVGQWVQVDAQVLCDGHDIIQAELQFKPASQKECTKKFKMGNMSEPNCMMESSCSNP